MHCELALDGAGPVGRIVNPLGPNPTVHPTQKRMIDVMLIFKSIWPRSNFMPEAIRCIVYVLLDHFRENDCMTSAHMSPNSSTDSTSPPHMRL